MNTKDFQVAIERQQDIKRYIERENKARSAQAEEQTTKKRQQRRKLPILSLFF